MLMRKGDVLFMNMHQKKSYIGFFIWGYLFFLAWWWWGTTL